MKGRKVETKYTNANSPPTIRYTIDTLSSTFQRYTTAPVKKKRTEECRRGGRREMHV